MSLLLTACPAPQPASQPTPGPTQQPTPAPDPSSPQNPNGPQIPQDPNPTTPLQVQGRLYDAATGKPLSGATALLGSTQVVTDANGRFNATIPPASTPLVTTFLADGYVPLTVSGYTGGTLFLLPKASTPTSTRSVTVSMSAPAGSIAQSVLAIAVKPTGYAVASTAYLGSPTFSEAGTASVTVTLPEGEATVLAYGINSTVVGALQAAVASEMTLSLSSISHYDVYQTTIGNIPAGGNTTQLAAYGLSWPSENPDMPNLVWLSTLSGATDSLPVVALPPATAFNLQQASYVVEVSAVTTATPRVTLSQRTQALERSGAHQVTLLSAPQAQSVTGAFGILPAKVTGATAYTADVLDAETQQPLWRILSLGENPPNLTVPGLPESLSSWNLPTGTSYAIRSGAADGVLGFRVSGAYARGNAIAVSR